MRGGDRRAPRPSPIVREAARAAALGMRPGAIGRLRPGAARRRSSRAAPVRPTRRGLERLVCAHAIRTRNPENHPAHQCWARSRRYRRSARVRCAGERLRRLVLDKLDGGHNHREHRSSRRVHRRNRPQQEPPPRRGRLPRRGAGGKARPSNALQRVAAPRRLTPSPRRLSSSPSRATGATSHTWGSRPRS